MLVVINIRGFVLVDIRGWRHYNTAIAVCSGHIRCDNTFPGGTMTRSTILFIKHLFAVIHAFIWTRIIIIIIQPAFQGIGIVRSIMVSVILAGVCALLIKSGMDKFVGDGINPHTYSMNHAGFFGMQFNSLVFSAIALFLVSLVSWRFVFLDLGTMKVSTENLYWNGLFMELPVYIVSFLFIFFHRRFDLSRRILNDQSNVFDSWW